MRQSRKQQIRQYINFGQMARKLEGNSPIFVKEYIVPLLLEHFQRALALILDHPQCQRFLVVSVMEGEWGREWRVSNRRRDINAAKCCTWADRCKVGRTFFRRIQWRIFWATTSWLASTVIRAMHCWKAFIVSGCLRCCCRGWKFRVCRGGEDNSFDISLLAY